MAQEITTKQNSQLNAKGPNIDANYGPWESISEYETWRESVVGKSVEDATVIAVKDSAKGIVKYIRKTIGGTSSWYEDGAGMTAVEKAELVAKIEEVQGKIPTKLSALTNDAGYVGAVEIKNVKSELSTELKTTFAGDVNTAKSSALAAQASATSAQASAVTTAAKAAEIEELLSGWDRSSTVTADIAAQVALNTTAIEELQEGGGVVAASKIKVYNTLAELKEATDLEEGNIAITLGCYAAGDGGGSTYRIVTSVPTYTKYGKTNGTNTTKTASVDGYTLISLDDSLYADIVINGNVINARQLGFKDTKGAFETNHYDNKDHAAIYCNYCDRKNRTYTLFFPAGVWAFSETSWQRTDYSRAGVHLEGCTVQNGGEGMGISIIMPYDSGQKFVWRMSKWDDVTSTGHTSGFATANNVVKNFTFTSGDGMGVIAQSTSFCKVSSSKYVGCMLLIRSVTCDEYDGLYFSYVRGSAMWIQRCCETKFGYINLRHVGYRRNGTNYYPVKFLADWNVASSISAVRFEYFNIEACNLTYFYGVKGCNFTHCEFGDIQIEANMGFSVQGNIYYTKNNQVSSLVTLSGGTYKAATGVTFSSNLESYGITLENIYNNKSKYLASYDEAEEKVYIFGGTIGFNPIVVDTITATNFGSAKAMVDYDSEGNMLTEDDGTPKVRRVRQVAVVSYGANEETNKCITIKYCFLGDNTGFSADGPWIVYDDGKNTVTTGVVAVMQPIVSSDKPFRIVGGKKKIICNPILKDPSAQFAINGCSSNSLINTTISGSKAPFGMAVSLGADNSFSFQIKPNKSYGVRMYCNSAVSVQLKAFQVYKNGEYTSVSTGSYSASAGWNLIPLPAQTDITDVTSARIKSYGAAGFNSVNNYIDGVYEL